MKIVKKYPKTPIKSIKTLAPKSVRTLPKTLSKNFPRNQRIVNRIKILLAKVLEEAFQFIKLVDKKENLRIGFKGLSWSKKYTWNLHFRAVLNNIGPKNDTENACNISSPMCTYDIGFIRHKNGMDQKRSFFVRLMRQFSIHIKIAVKSLLYDSDKYYNWIGKVQTFGAWLSSSLKQFQLIHQRTFALKNSNIY